MLPTRATINDYGGIKQDEAAVEDATTDGSADEWNEVAADTAGLSKTGCRAWRTALGKASSPIDDPVSNVHDANWGNDNGVKAACTRNTTGTYDYTWPATVTDELGNTKTLDIRRCWASYESASTAYHLSAVRTAANVVRVYVRNTSGTLVDPVGVPITVFWV